MEKCPSGDGIAESADRAALLGFYSTSELQYVATYVAVAFGGLAEFGIMIQPGLWIWSRAIVAALLPPTAFVFAYFFKSATTWRCQVQTLLRHSIPNSDILASFHEETKLFFQPPRELDLSNRLDALDLYYACLVRKNLHNDRLARMTWGGRPNAYCVTAALLVLGIVIATIVVISFNLH